MFFIFSCKFNTFFQFREAKNFFLVTLIIDYVDLIMKKNDTKNFVVTIYDVKLLIETQELLKNFSQKVNYHKSQYFYLKIQSIQHNKGNLSYVVELFISDEKTEFDINTHHKHHQRLLRRIQSVFEFPHLGFLRSIQNEKM